MKLYSINTGYFKLDGGAMYGVVPKSIWNKLTPADDKNLTNWAIRSLLIEEDGKLILIDTGNGTKQSEKFFSYYYLNGDDSLEKSLAKHGFTKDDITDVILTHLHFDHCGGAIEKHGDKLIPAFKNATFWSTEAHWKWAIHPNDREKASFLKENILPIKESGQLRFVDLEKQEEGKFHLHPSAISKNISFFIANGHTHSMLVPVINCNTKTIVYGADLLPSVYHLPVSYVPGYDMFPLTSMHEKKLFLQNALEKDHIIFFEHDAENECCSLKLTEKGIRQKDIFKLTEILI
jgi:glyoxylase-like metal-dependent hydrolase (beta-lactamase superfamily II)